MKSMHLWSVDGLNAAKQFTLYVLLTTQLLLLHWISWPGAVLCLLMMDILYVCISSSGSWCLRHRASAAASTSREGSRVTSSKTGRPTYFHSVLDCISMNMRVYLFINMY